MSLAIDWYRLYRIGASHHDRERLRLEQDYPRQVNAGWWREDAGIAPVAPS
jgi:hypothetical protein